MHFNKNYAQTNFITGMRALAILLVFLIHSGGGGLRDLGDASNTFVDIGKYGVQMFFVISGFTIFYQLYESGHSLQKFLMIRISRISIPYFPLLAIMFIYMNYGGENFISWADKFNDGVLSIENLFYHMTYLGAYDVKYANTILGVEWTLNIEVFFYVFFATIITFGKFKLSKRNLWAGLIVLVIVDVVVKSLGRSGHIDELLVHWMPFKYGWIFFLGGIAYHIRSQLVKTMLIEKQNKISNICILSSLIFFVVLLLADPSNKLRIFSSTFFALWTFLLIIFVRDEAKLTSILTNRASLFIGSISFSFYLWHNIVIASDIVSILGAGGNDTVVFSLNLLVTVTVSFVWYKLFEGVIYNNVKAHINNKIKTSVK